MVVKNKKKIKTDTFGEPVGILDGSGKTRHYVEGGMVPLPGKKDPNNKTLIRGFASHNINTGTFRVRGMYLSEDDMVKLLDNESLIRKTMQDNRVRRAMSALGVTNKKQLKRTVAGL